MRYLPAVTTALAIAGVVGFALHLTSGDLWCLLGLLALGVVPDTVPKDPEAEKARYEYKARVREIEEREKKAGIRDDEDNVDG